ncbi:pentapeptide repeat-containing protein [uncultured Celeribacter sp.]|uniref:pentapeptide repeat-containing protein n=1 Tax=uncultured Celeribacter sp. TaxID=1303376 RepID=UPI002AA6D9C2|nr:pentapeptide repeat-containing protein [uncultured Celeribacter sp.]
MTDFATRLNEMLSQPVLPWTILGVIVVGVLLGQVQKHVPDDPIERMKRLFGVPNIPHGLALFIAVLWGALLLVLFVGLVTLLYEIVWGMAAPVSREGEGDFRFLLAKITALTAVLGALVALPFTALRLKLTTEQNRHNQDVLYNEKLHNALDDLHARRQLSDGQWEDDIIRRNGAIDRLEALVQERPEMAPRISRMLCVYAREISREYPADPPPENKPLSELKIWIKSLSVKRSDIANAVRVVGTMRTIKGVNSFDLFNDLERVNLQGAELSGLDFSGDLLNDSGLDGADLTLTIMENTILARATMNGSIIEDADFCRAKLNKVQLSGAECSSANFTNADLTGVNFTGANLTTVRLWAFEFDSETCFERTSPFGSSLRAVDLTRFTKLPFSLDFVFGDSSVELPSSVEAHEVSHWSNRKLNDVNFENEWSQFYQTHSPQLRDAKP